MENEQVEYATTVKKLFTYDKRNKGNCRIIVVQIIEAKEFFVDNKN